MDELELLQREYIGVVADYKTRIKKLQKEYDKQLLLEKLSDEEKVLLGEVYGEK